MPYQQSITPLRAGVVRAECGPMHVTISAAVGKVPQSEMAVKAAMASVDAAINTLNQAAQGVGEYMIRLDNKEDTLAVSITNIESTRSRIEDADFAEEQMNLIRAQIVQQTGFASFAQANAAPQLVLSLFR